MSDPSTGPDPSRLRACEDLAERLARPGALRLVRRLQASGLLPAPSEGADPAPRPAPVRPRPISIWRPEVRDGERVFVRPPVGPFGDHYAVRPVLRARRPDGLRRRVCFFGESVAAGYLYAPGYTPAGVLQDCLGGIAGGSYEVVDLARTNETLASLVDTVEASLQLEPDVLVVWAGNNWNLLETPDVSPYAPSVRARQRYAAMLREDGVWGPAEHAARAVLERAGAALEAVARLARSAGAAVVLVVPEANLADWETRQPVVWLPGDRTAAWHALHAEATACMARADWQGVLVRADRMADLDEGTCPTPYRLMARAWRAQGDEARAAEAARGEVDRCHYATLGVLGSPQVTSMGRAVQRRAAAAHGFAAVDLAGVFARHTGSPLPDRRLFLDYCHLTSEGIRVAMAAVAARILALDGGEVDRPEWREVLGRAPEPAPEVEATARFGAALHTAHRLAPVGDRRELIDYWCAAALDASEGVAGAMRDLVEARCAPGPAVLTAAQMRNRASAYRLSLQHGWKWAFLDADVIEAVCDALQERDPSLQGDVERWLPAHHGPGTRGLDLVREPRYLREPLERFYPEAMDFDDLERRAAFRAIWPVSRFCLPADGAQPVELEVTARLPAAVVRLEQAGTVGVAVNGAWLGSLEAGPGWRRAAFRVPARVLRRGLNTVSVHWPPPPPVGEAALRQAADRLELGLEADLHPVFGELCSVRVAARE